MVLDSKIICFLHENCICATITSLTFDLCIVSTIMNRAFQKITVHRKLPYNIALQLNSSSALSFTRHRMNVVGSNSFFFHSALLALQWIVWIFRLYSLSLAATINQNRSIRVRKVRKLSNYWKAMTTFETISLQDPCRTEMFGHA